MSNIGIMSKKGSKIILSEYLRPNTTVEVHELNYGEYIVALIEPPHAIIFKTLVDFIDYYYRDLRVMKYVTMDSDDWESIDVFSYDQLLSEFNKKL